MTVALILQLTFPAANAGTHAGVFLNCPKEIDAQH